MRHIVNPKQSEFFDPYERLFAPAPYKRVREGWQGVFRHVILEVMPVGLVAKHFSEEMGRPTKELYSMAGLVLIMQFKDWTVEQAVDAYLFDTSVQYALNLEPAQQTLSTRTLERYLRLFRENDIAAAVYEHVSAVLVEKLDLEVSKQRLDSSHVFSDMAVFGRTQLMGVTIKRLVTQVRRHDNAAYEALPEALRQRYAPSANRLFGDTAKDAQARRRLRQKVAEDMVWLLDHFADDANHCTRSTYKALCTVFEEQCEVRKEKVVLKAKAGAHVTQNPSDPEATYDGKKGPGYQVQLSETCHEDNEVQLITCALPQTAAEADPQALAPVVDALRAHERLPEALLADAAYGSDDNVQACKKDGIELTSPVNRSKLDPDKLNVGDFTIDPETEQVQRCPAGHAPLASTYEEEKEQTTTRMDARVCETCPLRAQCPVQGKGKTRTFRHTPAERRRAERRRHEATDAFRDAYRKRAGIEGTISGMKRRTGLGRLRVRGRPAVYTAIYLKVAGWNMLRAAAAQKMRAHIAKSITQRHLNHLTNHLRDIFHALVDLLSPHRRPHTAKFIFTQPKTKSNPTTLHPTLPLLSVASYKGSEIPRYVNPLISTCYKLPSEIIHFRLSEIAVSAFNINDLRISEISHFRLVPSFRDSVSECVKRHPFATPWWSE